jgi:hypothetical protein
MIIEPERVAGSEFYILPLLWALSGKNSDDYCRYPETNCLHGTALCGSMSSAGTWSPMNSAANIMLRRAGVRVRLAFDRRVHLAVFVNVNSPGIPAAPRRRRRRIIANWQTYDFPVEPEAMGTILSLVKRARNCW